MKIIINVAFALGISFIVLASALSSTNGEIELNNEMLDNYILVIALPTNNAPSFVTVSPIEVFKKYC